VTLATAGPGQQHPRLITRAGRGFSSFVEGVLWAGRAGRSWFCRVGTEPTYGPRSNLLRGSPRVLPFTGRIEGTAPASKTRAESDRRPVPLVVRLPRSGLAERRRQLGGSYPLRARSAVALDPGEDDVAPHESDERVDRQRRGCHREHDHQSDHDGQAEDRISYEARPGGHVGKRCRPVRGDQGCRRGEPSASRARSFTGQQPRGHAASRQSMAQTVQRTPFRIVAYTAVSPTLLHPAREAGHRPSDERGLLFARGMSGRMRGLCRPDMVAVTVRGEVRRWLRSSATAVRGRC
jgi:hypothetical protein